MFTFLKSLLLPKLEIAKAAILSGSGTAMIAAAASLFDAVGAPDTASDLRKAAEGLSEGDKAKLAKAEMKLQAGLFNYLLGLDGDKVITVSALPPVGDEEVPHELAACLAACQPTAMTAASAPTAIWTPEQRDRFFAMIGAILRGFVAGK